MEHIMEMVIEYVIIALNLMGLAVIVRTAAKGFASWLKGNPRTAITLLEGFSCALDFLMGGEILHTVTATSMAAILQVGGIVVLRVSLALLIHWEVVNEEKALEEHRRQHEAE